MAKWGEDDSAPVPGTEYFDTVEQMTVDSKELAKLREDQRFLQALMDAGVDNWEGYGEACLATADLEDPEL